MRSARSFFVSLSALLCFLAFFLAFFVFLFGPLPPWDEGCVACCMAVATSVSRSAGNGNTQHACALLDQWLGFEGPVESLVSRNKIQRKDPALCSLPVRPTAWRDGAGKGGQRIHTHCQ